MLVSLKLRYSYSDSGMPSNTDFEHVFRTRNLCFSALSIQMISDEVVFTLPSPLILQTMVTGLFPFPKEFVLPGAHKSDYSEMWSTNWMLTNKMSFKCGFTLTHMAECKGSLSFRAWRPWSNKAGCNVINNSVYPHKCSHWYPATGLFMWCIKMRKKQTETSKRLEREPSTVKQKPTIMMTETQLSAGPSVTIYTTAL